MPTPNEILQSLIDDLTAELAPLNSIYHNFAKYRVEAGFDGGFFLEVHAPDHVRFMVPTSYQSFPVHFIETKEVEYLDLSFVIDISGHEHNIYD